MLKNVKLHFFGYLIFVYIFKHYLNKFFKNMRLSIKSIFIIGILLFLTSCQGKQGKGEDFMYVMLFVYFPFLFAIFFFLIKETIAKSKRSNLNIGRAFFEKTKKPLLIIGIVGLVVFSINKIMGGSSLKTIIDDIERKEIIDLKKGGFWKVIDKKAPYIAPKDIESYYEKHKTQDTFFLQYVKWWKDYEENPYRVSYKTWKSHFENETDKFRIAMISFCGDDTLQTFNLLNECDSTRTGVNYIYAQTHMKSNNLLAAEKYFLKEIKHNGWNSEALNELKRMYQTRDFVKQNGIVFTPQQHYNISQRRVFALYEYPSIKKELPKERGLTAALFNEQYQTYFKLFFIQIFNIQNINAFVGALVIFIAWIFFLWKQNPFSKLAYQKIGLVVLIFLITFTFLLPVYFYTITLITLNYIDNRFLYYVLGVGFFEEIIKFIPVLIFILVYKKKEEVYNYLFVAALSALLFASLENKMYFNKYSIELIDIRGLMCVILHVAWTTLITYFLVWRMFKKEGKGIVLWTFIGFVLAVFTHGIYDWFLDIGNPMLAFLIFPLFVHILADIYNNGLNASTSFSYEKSLEYKKNGYIISLSILVIILLKYVLVAIDYDSIEFANDALMGNSFNSLYMITFLSMSLGKMDIFYGYWKKIGIPKSLGDLLFPRVVNSSNFLNKRVSILFQKKISIVGSTIHRTVIKGKDDWYIVQLNEPIQVGKITSEYVFMYFEDYNASVEEDYFCNVQIALPVHGLKGFDGIYYEGKMKTIGLRRLKEA